jgi:D-lactate dehydrogenase
MARVMGRPREEERSLDQVVAVLAERAGVEIARPDATGTCCGLAFGSKGYEDAHARMLAELVDRMWAWSREGRIPIAIDAASCVYAVKTSAELLDDERRRRLAALRVIEVSALARDVLLPRLPVRQVGGRVALHPTCASRKIDGGAALQTVAQRCATSVTVPVNLGCCAMAGDRGLLLPDLTASATRDETAELARLAREGALDRRYANNLSCEIAMTQATGAPYLSILCLVEEATRPR